MDHGPVKCYWFLLAHSLKTKFEHIHSAGERTLVELEGFAEVTVPSYPKSPPMASALDLTPHPQAQTIPAGLCSERTEGT